MQNIPMTSKCQNSCHGEVADWTNHGSHVVFHHRVYRSDLSPPKNKICWQKWSIIPDKIFLSLMTSFIHEIISRLRKN